MDELICARRNCGKGIDPNTLDDCEVEAVLTDLVEAPDPFCSKMILRGRVRFLCPDCTTVFRAELMGQEGENVPDDYWDDDGEECDIELH